MIKKEKERKRKKERKKERKKGVTFRFPQDVLDVKKDSCVVDLTYGTTSYVCKMYMLVQFS